MEHQLGTLMAQYGAWFVFASVLAEQIGLPVPGSLVVVLAGAMAAAGHLSLAGSVIAALVACLIGDSAWYAAGRRYGARVLHTLCRVSLSPDSCIHQSELNFERWRGWSLVIAKFVPGLSLIAPPLVGALGLRVRTFLQLDTLGALLWVGIATALGYVFAGQIDHLLLVLGDVGTRAFELGLVVLALYVGGRWWWRRRVRAALRMARITVTDLHAAVAGDSAPLIVDARSRTSRALDPRIIKGAILLDPGNIANSLRGIPRDRDIVSYCNCPNEATAARTASILVRRGYRHVRPLLGGLDAWVDAGYATQALAPTSVPERGVAPHAHATH
ncbi:MAG TPA: DedA family protein/thiosulfate sulfurtransferase GlpE [Rhodanobacteraceae bacterium]